MHGSHHCSAMKYRTIELILLCKQMCKSEPTLRFGPNSHRACSASVTAGQVCNKLAVYRKLVCNASVSSNKTLISGSSGLEEVRLRWVHESTPERCLGLLTPYNIKGSRRYLHKWRPFARKRFNVHIA